jgi:hypothetical protein
LRVRIARQSNKWRRIDAHQKKPAGRLADLMTTSDYRWAKQQKEILTFSRTSSAQTTCCKHRLMWPKFTRLKNDNDNGLHVNFRKLKHTKTHLCWKKTPAKECCQKTAKSTMMRIGKVTSPEVLALTFPPSALPRDFHNHKVVSIIVKNEDCLTKCVQHAL